MSAKATILKEYAEWAFKALEDTIKEMEDNERMYKPTEVSNNIDWLVNHLCRISNVSLPRIIKGDPNYKPAMWPDDYRDHVYSWERYLSDLSAGKRMVVDGIGKLTDAQLEEEIPLWGGKRKRKEGLFAYIGEIIHHKGQIAYIRGTVKRLKEKNPNFLNV